MRQDTSINFTLKRSLNTIIPTKHVQATLTGSIAAMAMIGFLLFVELTNTGNNLGLKMMKYLILAIPMSIGLARLKEQVSNKYRFFQKGILFAAVASLVAATILTFSFIITVGIDTFNLATITANMTHVDELGKSHGFVPILSAAMLFLEVFVMSMITSFAILLYQHDHARTA
ncbi:MAG: hypothetical protein AB8E82_00970 [Aureispira sp.]